MKGEELRLQGVFCWIMGKALDCTKMQNKAMKLIMDADVALEMRYSEHPHCPKGMCERKTGVLCPAGRHFITLSGLGDYIEMLGEGGPANLSGKISQYIRDRTLWDAKLDDQPISDFIREEEYTAEMIAEGFGKNTLPPYFGLSPWNEAKRQRYFVEE